MTPDRADDVPLQGPPGYRELVNYNRANYTPGLNTVANPNADYVAPTVSGGWGQLAYYFTDTVWAGFYYGQVKYNLSQNRKNTLSTAAVEREQQYVVNLVYDPKSIPDEQLEADLIAARDWQRFLPGYHLIRPREEQRGAASSGIAHAENEGTPPFSR